MSTNELIKLLSRMKHSFSPEHAGIKLETIRKLQKRQIRAANLLIAYHEALCFMQAYPDNPAVRQVVDQELKAFAERVKHYEETHPGDNHLDDTGLAETIIHYPYNYLMANWLANRFGAAVDIDWDDYNKKEGDPISGMLPLFALYTENDGIDDEDLATEDWIRMTLAGSQTTLQWFLRQLDRLQMSFEIKQYLYENAEPMLKWHLDRTRASRTLARLPGRKVIYQRNAIRKPMIDLDRSVRRHAPTIKLVPGKKAEDLIDVLISAQLPRHRELFPVLFANPAEVYLTTPGRGLEIYLLGMRPESRMPLESNYSALLIKNGVPIGYGISVLFFERCEIAINIFDSFRSGEAAFIFEHFVRVFYHHFGGRDFLMRKWQVGNENEEGIKSGSYWFYYKLGFRSIDPAVDALATEEWGKIEADRTYRSDAKTLRKLAKSDLYLAPGKKTRKPYRELSVIKLGFAVTNMVASKFNGNRGAALRWAVSQVSSSLRELGMSRWTGVKKLQLERFSPLLALIPDLESWGRQAKKDLVQIVESKAAFQERDYVRRLQRHKRLYRALEDIERNM
jgi:hypothetical protein